MSWDAQSTVTEMRRGLRIKESLPVRWSTRR